MIPNARHAVAGSLLATLAVAPARAQNPTPPAWDSVAAILQTTTTATGGYYRYNLPRADLTVRIGDVTVATALAAGAWAGFSGTPSDATMMGDLVLLATEVRPVQAELLRQGIAVMAVHNHLVGEEPKLTYLHYHAEGPATDLARRLSAVVSLTGTPRPVAAQAPVPLTIDTPMVFGALGRSGRARGAVAQVTLILVPDSVTMHGRVVVPAMGYGTPVNVQAVSATRAVATGDFSVPARAVGPVTRALIQRGITITALHSHLVGESPVVSYIHFWADGPLADVLAGLRAAADAAR
jgi:hypothetical protein